jgi:hypothetical protein
MTEATAQDVTVLLQAWSRGDQSALARLIPLVMDELRRLAGRTGRTGRISWPSVPSSCARSS